MKPVVINQILNVKIEGIGSKGDGIAKIEGYTIIVINNAMDISIGDTCKVRITKICEKYSFAEVEQ